MADTLPPDVRLKLDQTLAQWRAWNCQPVLEAPPPVLHALGDGLSNYSVLVGTDQRQYVIRIDGRQVFANHLSRAAEWRVLHTAHRASIAPAPLYFNPELGALVCDYHSPAIENQNSAKAIGALLRAIHALPSVHYKLDLSDRIDAYEHQLGQDKIDQSIEGKDMRQDALVALEQLSEQPQSAVLCHNDLLAANRINTSTGLLAIDWEYCAMGSPWFDLAVIVVGDRNNAEQKEALVEAYLQRPATPPEQLTLERYCKVYRYLEWLWYLANKRARLSP